MKAFKFILPVITFFMLGSCKKFLEVDPKDYAPDNETIFDKTSAETALRGTYRALADNSYYGSTFQSDGYLQGDNLDWTDSRTVSLQFIQHNVRGDNEEVASAWTAIYKTINRANQVIAQVPEVQDPLFLQKDKNRLVGEALFIRALAYFDLARTWGGAQIVLTPTKTVNDQRGIKRSTVEQTYAQVLTDLKAAEPLLSDSINRIRATAPTVRALRARLHLYLKEWPLAEEYADKVIALTRYKLIKPYSAFFANNVVATEESVFELNYSSTNLNSHRGQWQPPANSGTRRWAPNAAFLALINDPLVGGNRSAMVAKTTQGQWYGNMYYRTPATDPAYIIRIAELYLIRAEARAQQPGKLAGAISDLNAVRDRAGLAGTTATTQDQVLLAIENERRLEFAFEPHRWYDLVRTNRAGAVTGVTDPKKYVLPIPVGELTVDNALDPNPGYN